MKKTLENIIKSSKQIKAIYTMLGSFAIRTIGLFVKTDDRLILMNSFGGKKYDDSPKALFEYMLRDSRFNDYSFVWAFHNPERFTIEGAETVKTDTFKYFITALKAKCWVTNSGIERGLNFKKKQTVYLNTWHGTPLKLMGRDIPGESDEFRLNHDIQCSQSKYETEIFSRVFGLKKECFAEVGLPRNDELANATTQRQAEIKEALGIPKEKKLILYAPTYREYDRDDSLNCIQQIKLDLDKWKHKLGNEWVLLLRLHYEVAKAVGDAADGEFAIDVSQHESINDLMIASDVLVTDYSSIMFDYSILNKPIYIYAYDYDEYSKRRGLYFDVREELCGGSITVDELIELISIFNTQDNLKKIATFREKYVNSFGQATEQTVEILFNKLRKQ